MLARTIKDKNKNKNKPKTSKNKQEQKQRGTTRTRTRMKGQQQARTIIRIVTTMKEEGNEGEVQHHPQHSNI